MTTATETCCCGASITIRTAYPSDAAHRLDDFRAAHAVCRERPAVYHPPLPDPKPKRPASDALELTPAG